MTDVIGRGVIEVVADATELKAGINDAKTSLQSLKDAAKDAGESLTSSSTGYLRSLEKQAAALERQAATFGKSKSEIASYNAAQQGVSATAAGMVARMQAAEVSIKAQSAAAKAASIAAAGFGSAQAAAGAGLEHFGFQTAGAKRELLVLAHELSQGNFARFGGSMLVLGERTGAAALLFSGLGIAALASVAALGLFAVAAFKGAAESKALSTALILTGNYAGKTGGQLSDMARSISAGVGTQAQAAEALTALAASGKIAGTQFETLAAAAVAFEKAGGPAIAKTVEEFVKLADEPAKASAKLNETLHYLNQATYERIAALVEQGRSEEAAALAQDTYAKAVTDRAREMVQSLGYLGQAWKWLGERAKASWDAMLNIGRESSTTDKLGDLRRQLDAALAGRQRAIDNGQGAGNAKWIDSLNAQMLALQQSEQSAQKVTAETGKQAAAELLAVHATELLNTQIASNATRQQKMNKELEDTKRLFAEIRAVNPDSELLKKEPGELASIRAKYTDKAAEARDSAATKMLQTLREQEATFKAQIVSEGTLNASEKERSKFVQLLADLKDKKILTADQKSLLAAHDTILAQLGINVAAEKTVELKKQEAAEEEKRARALENTRNKVEALTRTITSSIEGQREQFDKRLDVFGMGSQALEQLNATKSIDKEFRRYQKELTDTAAHDDTLGSVAYADGVARIKSSLAEALKLNAEFYDALKAKQADWSNGASEAWANYVDGARNVAKQTEGLFTHAFQGMEDALVGFITTGKLNFTSLAQSILADLARIIIKQQIAAAGTAAMSSGGWLSGLMSMFGGSGGGAAAQPSMFSGDPRASGGPVAPFSVHQVNERGPELLRVGNRDMLMMGAQGGNITPAGGSTAQSPSTSIVFQIASGVGRNELAAMVPALTEHIKASLQMTMRRPGWQGA